MKIKPGAKIRGIQPEMVLAFNIVDEVYKKYGSECIITECTGGDHGRGSLHFVGFGGDVRTRMFSAPELDCIELDLRNALGSEFDVVLESNHFHIEFQPKTQ
jgi:hypothetical protein